MRSSPPVPGGQVDFVREPDNPADANAVAVHDQAGRRIGYLFREIAAEYAALLDLGCVRLFGRLAAPGEPGYDPARAGFSPALFVWVYVDEARLSQVLARTA